MKKIVIPRPGGYERLQVVDAPDPRPARGEILIETAAVGVNYADCIARMGLYASARELAGYPLVPGFELAGTVLALGDGVVGPQPGTRVVGVTLFGGYASKICLPAARVFVLPNGLSLEEAAGVPTAYLTAWYALHRLAHTGKGERILVHSAAGGVGGALLQLGRAAGLVTTGVVGGSHKVELAKELGADDVIDKSATNLWRAAETISPEGYDVICDANGAATLADSYRHLAPAGRLVVYGFHSMLPRQGGRPSWPRLALGWLRTPRFDPLRLTRDNRSVMGFNLSFLSQREQLLAKAMRDLIARLGQGELRPLPIRRYAFEDVVQAHKDIESGTTTGKLILCLDHRDPAGAD